MTNEKAIYVNWYIVQLLTVFINRTVHSTLSLITVSPNVNNVRKIQFQYGNLCYIKYFMNSYNIKG